MDEPVFTYLTEGLWGQIHSFWGSSRLCDERLYINAYFSFLLIFQFYSCWHSSWNLLLLTLACQEFEMLSPTYQAAWSFLKYSSLQIRQNPKSELTGSTLSLQLISWYAGNTIKISEKLSHLWSWQGKIFIDQKKTKCFWFKIVMDRKIKMKYCAFHLQVFCCIGLNIFNSGLSYSSELQHA